jgi:hypothetical protein
MKEGVMKNIPLGIKILAIIFLLVAISDFLLFVVWMSSLETTVEWTPKTIGVAIAIAIQHIFLPAISLFAGIGLLRLKRWGFICASTSLIVGGIIFALRLAHEFIRGFAMDSIVSKNVTMIASFLLTALVVVMLIRYMKTKISNT